MTLTGTLAIGSVITSTFSPVGDIINLVMMSYLFFRATATGLSLINTVTGAISAGLTLTQ